MRDHSILKIHPVDHHVTNVIDKFNIFTSNILGKKMLLYIHISVIFCNFFFFFYSSTSNNRHIIMESMIKALNAVAFAVKTGKTENNMCVETDCTF